MGPAQDMRELGARGARALHAARTPEERSAAGRKAHVGRAVAYVLRNVDLLTPAHRARLAEALTTGSGE
jgi:hypothetical protein